jgi:tetratricopeptide (TPR) repeat protein
MLRFSWLLPLLFAAAAHAGPPGLRKKALELFELSDKDYKAGKFEEAADLLRQAYGLYPEPILLYNLGRALESVGDTQGAVDEYEHYLRVAKQVDDRAAIERRIETLKAQLAKQQEVTPPPPPPEKLPPPLPVRVEPAIPEDNEELDVPATIGWGAIGTGGAIVVTGALFGWRASSNHDDAVNEPGQQKAVDLQSTAQHEATIANVLFVVGGAIAIGGGVYELIHRGTDDPGPRVSLTPRGVTVGWAW